ncbi:MAG: cation:proton antiporter [Acidobacteriota bacterium]|nr:cation:proton antiporter [Acidobacteriota bacterium]
MTVPATHGASGILIELGLVVLSLAILSRLASRWNFSAIPFYLLAGLAFGSGGLAPLRVSHEFIRTGADIGVILLLFMLGLSYTGAELKGSLRRGLPAGAIDFVFNFIPGLIAGLLMHWNWMGAVLLGGVTYISSSGVAARLLSDLQRLHHPETPAVLSVLVLEDLAMAIYLPIVAVLLARGDAREVAFSVAIAIAAVLLVLIVAVRYGERLSRAVAHESDEIILLTVFGAVLLVAGIAERIHVSAAIGAFLVGIAASGPLAEQSHRLISPLRDLFAATFFFFFGLEIDPSVLPRVLPLALILAGVTALTKIASGYWAARRAGSDVRGRLRAGSVLVARGEFSIVIAGLGSALEPRLGTLSAAYVLLLAIVGPLLARAAK